MRSKCCPIFMKFGFKPHEDIHDWCNYQFLTVERCKGFRIRYSLMAFYANQSAIFNHLNLHLPQKSNSLHTFLNKLCPSINWKIFFNQFPTQFLQVTSFLIKARAFDHRYGLNGLECYLVFIQKYPLEHWIYHLKFQVFWWPP